MALWINIILYNKVVYLKYDWMMINSLKTLGYKWHEAKHKKAQKQNLLITNLNSNIKIIK